MPIIKNSKLPTFKRLIAEGEIVLSKNRASQQYIRGLNIGLLNMMPDTALEATERQFFRLIGGYQVVQLYIYPFTLGNIPRNKKTQKHIDDYYYDFETIKTMGLDALIITGANVEGEDLSREVFFDELKTVFKWSYENVASTLCSCLATHAVMEILYQQKRVHQKNKCWGIFQHFTTNKTHPLLGSVGDSFSVPHSRYNKISQKQFTDAGAKILINSDIGVHLAVSKDLIRVVFFQGHPEYDTISLLKEYKREVIRFLGNERDYPEFPKHYLDLQAKAILLEYKDRLIAGEFSIQDFPEKLLVPMLENNWTTASKIIVNNWINCVYQITNKDVKKQFMDGLDKDNPLGSFE